MHSRIKRSPQFIDPNMELLGLVVAGLMDPEEKRLNQLLERLIIQNQKRGGTLNAFYYMGQIFTVVSVRHLHGVPVDQLDPSLHNEVNVYISELESYRADRKKLTQLLSTILPKCKNRHHIRDALPEALVMYLPHELRDLPRMDEEGFLLKSNPTLHEQFQKAIGIALYYTANRMIF